jgi:hypothetical protein
MEEESIRRYIKLVQAGFSTSDTTALPIAVAQQRMGVFGLLHADGELELRRRSGNPRPPIVDDMSSELVIRSQDHSAFDAWLARLLDESPRHARARRTLDRNSLKVILLWLLCWGVTIVLIWAIHSGLISIIRDLMTDWATKP